MSEPANPPAKPAAKPAVHKRSWKNLLLNKRYQLRFTLFMVGLSAVLMGVLGWWVMKEANEATTVAMARVRGEPCPKVPVLQDIVHLDAPAPEPVPVPDGGEPTAGEGEGAGGEDAPSRRTSVQLVESSMTLTPTVPADFADRIVAHHTCEIRQAGKLAHIERGRMRILWVLVATGLALMFGLAIYGIKMTHKVAGPLFKVSLYLAKMRDGRYDKVYNLRKGDQLVDFYEHFRTAHAGVVQLERDDVERIKATIAAAEAAGAGETDAVAELRAVLQRKEKSLE
jgi:hypothetical protein